MTGENCRCPCHRTDESGGAAPSTWGVDPNDITEALKACELCALLHRPIVTRVTRSRRKYKPPTPWTPTQADGEGPEA